MKVWTANDPTIAEMIDAAMRDEKPDWYQQIVRDYGSRMASVWLQEAVISLWRDTYSLA